MQCNRKVFAHGQRISAHALSGPTARGCGLHGLRQPPVTRPVPSISVCGVFERKLRGVRFFCAQRLRPVGSRSAVELEVSRPGRPPLPPTRRSDVADFELYLGTSRRGTLSEPGSCGYYRQFVARLLVQLRIVFHRNGRRDGLHRLHHWRLGLQFQSMDHATRADREPFRLLIVAYARFAI
jgi:hypothetical protein